jgi:8-oxo-dGTP pyrophosphatase MutT (NUDIX family)
MIKKCGIILWNHSKEKVFLVYGKKSSKWGFPKGHMEENETEIETAEREFYEETGYKLKHQLNEKSEKYVIRNNIYFIVKLHSEDDLLQETKIIPDQKEIEKSHWFGINELLSMNLSKFNFGLKTWILNKKYNSL